MNNATLLFLGTGTSEGVPRVSCLTHPEKHCEVCHDAIKVGSPNRRRNTSILISKTLKNKKKLNVLIDVGKFFYESSMNWFPPNTIKTIDAIVLTHSHADAVGGLDDLRDWTNNTQNIINVYLRKTDLASISQSYDYLVDRSKQTGGGGVANLKFNVINHNPFEVCGIKFTPLPVIHGPTQLANGYRFGNVTYISDTSSIPSETQKLISGSEILILDALRPRKTHGTHFTLEEAIAFARTVKPNKTLFTDAAHDVNHVQINNYLKKILWDENLDMQYAYDGQKLQIKL